MKIDMEEIERIGGIKNGHNPDIATAIRILELNGLLLDDDSKPETCNPCDDPRCDGNHPG